MSNKYTQRVEELIAELDSDTKKLQRQILELQAIVETNQEEAEATALAEDWDQELLGDDYLILQDEDIGNK